jgi:hypothetical protein
VTSQANTSASTGTQNKSTSSVQGTTNNENNNNNNRESKNDSKTLSNVTDSNSALAKLAATRSVLTEDTREKLQGIMNQLNSNKNR